jgi:hypothetical protein
MNMLRTWLFCFALFLGGSSFAGKPIPNGRPKRLVHNWNYITFPGTLPSDEGHPHFMVGKRHQEDEPRGLRLDIEQVSGCFDTNDITALLYRANGEIVEPTVLGKQMLKLRPGVNGTTDVMTWFPWGRNALTESWIEVSIGAERYWLEIPYGFDRNPTDPLPPSVRSGPPKFVPAMNWLTEHDHVLRWQNVHYDMGRASNGCDVSLIQSNPFDAKSEIDLYNSEGARGVYSPHTAVHILDAGGRAINGVCVDLHLDDTYLRRTDMFAFNRNGDDMRCWGQIEIKVANKTYRAIVPSSLYKYIHGHALEPAATAFLSTLRVGMSLREADLYSGNYISNGIRNHPVSPMEFHQYQYTFPHDGSEVTLQFDDAAKLVSWK